MLIDEMLNIPCTIIRRTPAAETGRYGRQIVEESQHGTVCYVEQRRRDEPEGQGELSSEDWFGAFLPTEKIFAGDAVVVTGFGEFEVVGDPGPFWDVDEQRVSHLEASLKQTDAEEGGS